MSKITSSRPHLKIQFWLHPFLFLCLVIMYPSPSWSSTLSSLINTAWSVNVWSNYRIDSTNCSNCDSPIHRCSEEGTLRIPIRSASKKPEPLMDITQPTTNIFYDFLLNTIPYLKKQTLQNKKDDDKLI